MKQFTSMSNKVAKIKLLDEVKAVVIGLRKDEYDQLADKFAVYANGYFFHPAYKLRKWDGKIRFFSKSGETYFNLLPEIVRALKNFGYKVSYIDKREPIDIQFQPIDKDYFSDYGWELGEHQVRAINAHIDKGNGIIIAGTGAGKAQPLYSKILTPYGWTTMGEIKVGDKVKTPDDADATVTGVFPQGMTNTYRIWFDDDTYVDASDEHLWVINYHRNVSHDGVPEHMRRYVAKRFNKETHTVTTLQLAELLNKTRSNWNNEYVTIDTVSPMKFGHYKKSPIDPYFMGAFVACGRFRAKRNLVFKADSEYSTDSDFYKTFSGMAKMSGLRATVTKFGFGLVNESRSQRSVGSIIRDFFSGNVAAKDRGVPDFYKNCQPMDRIRFVRGFMDAVAKVDGKKKLAWFMAPETVAYDMADIIRSFGAKVTVKKSALCETYKVSITSDIMKRFFFMESKKRKFYDRKRKKTSIPLTIGMSPERMRRRRRVVSVETLGRQLTQCISIDHPSKMYVTDYYTPTHNTVITGVLCDMYNKAGLKTIVIVPNTDLVTQTITELENFDLNVGEYSGDRKNLDAPIVVSTWQSLQHNPMIMAAFKAVIVDESHGVTGKELQNILNEYGGHIPVRVGMTGTLPKGEADLMTIKAVLGDVLCEIPAHELIEKGWLANLKIRMYCLKENFNVEWNKFQKTNPDEAAKLSFREFVDKMFPDFDAEMSYVRKHNQRTTFIADLVENLRGNAKGNTFILVKSVEYGKKLAKMISNAVFVYGKDKKAVRKKIYKLFDDNDNLVVISTFSLASTGLNIKRIFNLVFIDAGKSFTKIIQAIGRGLRRAHDKDSVTVYDIFSDLKYSKRHAAQRKAYYKEQKYEYTSRSIDYLQYYQDDA